MLIHSAGGEVRLMKMHVFPKLFHLHQMIHPLLLLSNNINEIKSTFTKCTWPKGEGSTKLFSASSALPNSLHNVSSLYLAFCRLAGEQRRTGDLLWKGGFSFEGKQLFASDCRMVCLDMDSSLDLPWASWNDGKKWEAVAILMPW